jgi:hypothetical protein
MFRSKVRFLVIPVVIIIVTVISTGVALAQDGSQAFHLYQQRAS